MNTEVKLEIPVLGWEDIKKKFGVSESEVSKDLMKPNYCNNFWYPWEKNGYDESGVEYVVSIFEEKFADASIKSKHDYRYTEIFLNTLEKHQFAYSLMDFLQ